MIASGFGKSMLTMATCVRPEKHENPEGDTFWTCSFRFNDAFAINSMGDTPAKAKENLLSLMISMGLQ